MKSEEELVHRTLAQTLLQGRLLPGTQLVETRLATLFGVSRERIRKVLQRLGHERLIELIPNRGAFVSSPTLHGARDIYDARRILEGGIVAWLAGRVSPAQLHTLIAHGKREHAALHAGDRALSIQLSGEFHILLAQYTGSDFVVRQLQELVSRTSMLVAFFETAAASHCACDEHDDILQALQKGDAARAVKAMHVHLSLIETRLQPRASEVVLQDPELEIAQAWGKTKPKTVSKVKAKPEGKTKARPGSFAA